MKGVNRLVEASAVGGCSVLESTDKEWAQGSEVVDQEASGEGDGTGCTTAPGVVCVHALVGGGLVPLEVTRQTSWATNCAFCIAN